MATHIHRYDSNGSLTSSKTVCASAVLNGIGIPSSSFHSTFTKRNLDAYEGVIRRNGFALRSRKSSIPKGSTVGSIRKVIPTLNDGANTVYMIRVKSHVLLLDREGKTIVDTDPRKRDKRRVLKIHAIWEKG